MSGWIRWLLVLVEMPWTCMVLITIETSNQIDWPMINDPEKIHSTNPESAPEASAGPHWTDRVQDGIRERTQEYKEWAHDWHVTAQQEWSEFKEHPRQSAAQGTASFRTMLNKYEHYFLAPPCPSMSRRWPPCLSASKRVF